MKTMTDIKRLHEVHWKYPNVPRRMGKTRYCLDCLLRAIQTNQVRRVAYIGMYMSWSMNAMREFLNMLRDENEDFQYFPKDNTILVRGCSVKFTSMDLVERKPDYDYSVTDYSARE